MSLSAYGLEAILRPMLRDYVAYPLLCVFLGLVVNAYHIRKLGNKEDKSR